MGNYNCFMTLVLEVLWCNGYNWLGPDLIISWGECLLILEYIMLGALDLASYVIFVL